MTFPWMVQYFNPPTDLLRLSFDRNISSIAFFELVNNSHEDLEIEYIYHEWPAANDSIFTVNLQGKSTFAGGTDASSPTEIPGDLDFVNTVDDRTIEAKNTRDIEFNYGLDADPSPYVVQIRFTNGWEISTSN